MTLHEVLTVLTDAKMVRRMEGEIYNARCPAHEEVTPSLMFGPRTDGSVHFQCFGGCTLEEVERAVERRMKEGRAG